MKISVYLLTFSILLAGCATVNERGEYEFKAAEMTARLTNAAGGAGAGTAAGIATGIGPWKGAAAGFVLGLTKDPHECSSGSAEETVESAATTDGAPGTYTGASQRDSNRRCGNRRGGGWFGFAPMGRDVGVRGAGGRAENRPATFCGNGRRLDGTCRSEKDSF